MPTVVNKSQQVYTGALRPQAHYSRIVSVTLYVTQAGGYAYVVTPPLGNELWLLGVQLWNSRQDVDVEQVTGVSIYTGTVEPKGFADVIKWEDILPLTDMYGKLAWWYFYGSIVHKSWEMDRLFTGAGRRFGIVAHRLAETGDVVTASFRISEG